MWKVRATYVLRWCSEVTSIKYYQRLGALVVFVAWCHPTAFGPDRISCFAQMARVPFAAQNTMIRMLAYVQSIVLSAL